MPLHSLFSASDYQQHSNRIVTEHRIRLPRCWPAICSRVELVLPQLLINSQRYGLILHYEFVEQF